ncbi:hypothetical protein QTP88_021481 [Uroleucon formosanum]
MTSEEYSGKPYKIIDSKREHKIGIVATSLSDFMTKAQQKLDINENEPIKVVLESDGTEIDEEDYFDTLETNTLIMILKSDQKWSPYDIRRLFKRAVGTVISSLEVKTLLLFLKYNTVESAYCGHRLIWASAYCGQTELVPIQMYINNVKSNRIIWVLGSVYVGNFILS